MAGPLTWLALALYHPPADPEVGKEFSLDGSSADPTGAVVRSGAQPGSPGAGPARVGGGAGLAMLTGSISPVLDDNLARLKTTFHLPENTDIVLREFIVAAPTPVRAAVMYVEGLVFSLGMNQFVLEPLMLTGALLPEDGLTLDKLVEGRLLPNNQVSVKPLWEDVMVPILMGTGLVLVDGVALGFVVEAKGWEHRTVGLPVTEQVVRGPQEAFNENIRVNTALLRRRLRTPDLVMEHSFIGRLSQTTVAMCYVKGLANPRLVEEARRRLAAIDVDYVPDSGYIEQYIEDRPTSMFPQVAATERPDRVAAFLAEGCVAVLVDGSPFALTVPAIFTAFFQSPEDYYLRWPYGVALRLVRIVAMFIALFLPSLWIAMLNFHPEMVPTPLLTAIAGTRDALPFPLIVEMLLMESGFELIREAGIRIPSTIGATIGIVGALILGQAAVAASIVSPTLIIIVALTALGSFAVPSFAASFSLRLMRFPMILLGGVLGFFGVAAGAFAIVVHLVTLRSFGVPYLATIAPPFPSADVALIGKLYQMERRPLFLRARNSWRQPNVVRRWDSPQPDSSDDPGSTKGDGGGGA